jgi:opacity protein-like surface antigen
MAIAMLLMISVINGFSQTHRVGFLINAAGYFPTQNNMNIGYGSGLGGVFYLNPNISLSLEWKYSRLSVDKQEGKLFDGALTVTPILASVHYNISLGKSITPYIFAGAGLFLSSFRLDKGIDLQEANVRRQEVKNGLGFCAGIGGTIKLNERLSLFLEALYLKRTSDAETIHFDNSPSTQFKINLSSFSILIGLNYF